MHIIERFIEHFGIHIADHVLTDFFKKHPTIFLVVGICLAILLLLLGLSLLRTPQRRTQATEKLKHEVTWWRNQLGVSGSNAFRSTKEVLSSWSSFQHLLAAHYVACILTAVLIGAATTLLVSANDVVSIVALSIFLADWLVILLVLKRNVSGWWKAVRTDLPHPESRGLSAGPSQK